MSEPRDAAVPGVGAGGPRLVVSRDAVARIGMSGRAVAKPRDAATVVLLREGPDGVEMLLLRRHRAMDFAPGAHVFPGGSVDARDGDADIAWTGTSPEELSQVLGAPPDRCRALAGAAVRETFEESGVLLTGEPGTAEDRLGLLAGSVSLGEVLRRRGHALHADALLPWARWITPEAADRRYDTWFFAAAMPVGQVADAGVSTAESDSAESDAAVWLRPEAALEAARAQEITLLPPTAVTLAEMAAFSSVGEILAQRRTITPRMPTVAIEDGQVLLAMPDGVEYPL